MPGSRSTVRRPRIANKPRNNLAYPSPAEAHHSRTGWTKPNRTRVARQDLSTIVRKMRGRRAEDRQRTYIHQLSEIDTFIQDAIANNRPIRGPELILNRFMDRVKVPRKNLAVNFITNELMTYAEDRRFVERTIHEIMTKLQREQPEWFYSQR